MPKNMKVLLISPTDNLETTLGKGKAFVNATEPHNLISLASYARSRGISDIRILDGYALNLSHEEILSYITDYSPNVIGLTCYTSDSPMTIKLCARIKERFPDKFVIVGHVHATVFCEEFFSRGKVDFVVHGEGEETLYELIMVLKEGGSLEDIPGIIYRSNNKTIKTKERYGIQDLDSLPKPAWDLVPMHLYKLPFYFHPKGNRSMITSRGCPVGCTFCAVHGGMKIRYQSAERMVSDYRDLVENYGANHIHFMDSLFPGNKRRIMEFCDRILREKKRVTWSSSAYSNCMSPELLNKMSAAGCTTISYGIESGNKEMLDNVQKKQSLEKVREVVRWTKEAGIKARGLFMLGMPGETVEHSLQTIKFAKELPLDGAQFSITTPYPGTELFNQLVRENKIDKMDWERYSAYSTFTDKEPIWMEDWMTSDILKNLQRKAILEFYLRPRLIFYELSKIRPRNIRDYFGGLMAIANLAYKKIGKSKKSGFSVLEAGF